uniref:UDP-N-acetylmuramate--L-alanine ligase n=1 Tax=uncultured bacterium contig00025 TaxID=1181514 RepID=A0A806KJR7_9BACT|nr:UDP-N-acetylmuramate--alanine ligase [uncultured bacterium contig00025]
MKKNILGEHVRRVHFIGIGGVSMSGLAEILLAEGYAVTGSDWNASDITRALARKGITVFPGNDAAYITDGIDLVVYTAAVKPDNTELLMARKKNIPTMVRAKLLGLIMKDYKYTVAVSGTHGKTTTTAVLAEVLLRAGLDPTVQIGGYMETIGGNYRVGSSQYFVLEACEYFDSFLQFYPYVGLILNVDSDHLDYFGTMERLTDSFRKFARTISGDGALVINADVPRLEYITEGLRCRVLTYGADSSRRNASHFSARGLRYDNDGLPSFTIMNGACEVADVTLRLRGKHNVNNALAVAAAAHALDIPADSLKNGLSTAIGAKRRFEHKGVHKNGAAVIDDYAHHPTEIKATLAAANNGLYKRIICAFQSHTYTRTQILLDDFAGAFTDCDIVLILPVYAARDAFAESESSGHLAELLTERIRGNGRDAHYFENFDAAREWLTEHARGGDLLITMGAGDIHVLGEKFLSTTSRALNK